MDSFMVLVGWDSVSEGSVAESETPSGLFCRRLLTMLISDRSKSGCVSVGVTISASAEGDSTFFSLMMGWRSASGFVELLFLL